MIVNDLYPTLIRGRFGVRIRRLQQLGLPVVQLRQDIRPPVGQRVEVHGEVGPHGDVENLRLNLEAAISMQG